MNKNNLLSLLLELFVADPNPNQDSTCFRLEATAKVPRRKWCLIWEMTVRGEGRDERWWKGFMMKMWDVQKKERQREWPA